MTEAIVYNLVCIATFFVGYLHGKHDERDRQLPRATATRKQLRDWRRDRLDLNPAMRKRSGA